MYEAKYELYLTPKVLELINLSVNKVPVMRLFTMGRFVSLFPSMICWRLRD
jgi:hypothetical protein